MNSLKIISGGQTGADLAGLWVATVFGIKTGGMAPKGWKTQLGSKPELGSLFNLSESESGYHGRTLENCESSTLTLIFASNIKSPGTKLTIHHCMLSKIRYRVFPFSEGSNVEKHAASSSSLIAEAIKTKLLLGDLILNVAGNSSSTSASTFTYTFLALSQALQQVLGVSPKIFTDHETLKVEAMLRDCYDRSVYDRLLEK